MKLPGLAISIGILLSMQCAAPAQGWETIRNCRLLSNDYNDGDSFHVEANGKEMIAQLYFCDTPESSMQIPERVAEQAAHFGVSEEQVLKAGKAAADFTKRTLKSPFSVTTIWQNARGASKLPRYYCTITTSDGKDLAELLVASGLARAFGVVANSPRSRGMKHYDSLERRAKNAGFGIFGNNQITRGSVDTTSDKAEIKTSSTPTPTPSNDSFQTDEVFARLQRELVEEGSVQRVTDEIPMPAGYKLPQHTSASEPPAPEIKKGSTGGTIKLNTASKTELEALPFVGPVIAEAIIRQRPYSSVDELRNIPGIGPKKFEQIKSLVEP